MKPARLPRLLTLASALFLAWSVYRTVGPHVAAPGYAGSTLSIRCLPRSSAHPDALGASVQLWQLTVDGRRLRWDEVERTGAWRVTGDEILSFLVHPDDPEPAALTCRGRSLVAAFVRSMGSGRIRFERDGEPVAEEDLYSSEQTMDVAVVEIPPRPPKAWVLGVLLLLFPAVAWRLGPGRGESGTERWLLCFLGILHLSVWASQRIGLGSDSIGYLEQTRRFLLQGIPGYYPPGYPAFLGLMDLLPGSGLGGLATLVQHAMAVTAVLWVYRFVRSVLPENAAYAAALVAGTGTPCWAAPQTVMSETLAFFGMAGALYFSAQSCETGSTVRAAIAGLLAGWAGLARMVPFAASVPSTLLLYLVRSPLRRTRLAIVFLAAVAVLPAGVLAWNASRSGDGRLAASVGFHLFNRVVTSQRQLDEGGAATQELLSILGGTDPRGRVHWEVAEQVNKVRSYAETERLLGRVAVEGIRKDPGSFLGSSLRQAWADYHADPCPDLFPWAYVTQVEPELETPPPLGLTRSSFEWRRSMDRAQGRAYPVLAWLGVGGFLLSAILRKFRPLTPLGWIPFGYLLATGFVEFVLGRYNATVFPFVAGMAMVPPVWLGGLASRWMRRLRPAVWSAEIPPHR